MLLAFRIFLKTIIEIIPTTTYEITSEANIAGKPNIELRTKAKGTYIINICDRLSDAARIGCRSALSAPLTISTMPCIP